VNGLRPERISVVDESGRLLADGAADEDGVGVGIDERKLAFEKRMRTEVEQIVTSVVGPGRARVQVTADFDRNRVTETSDRYDPDGRVVRSSQTREESSASNDGKDGQVSVGNELPGSQQTPPGTSNTPRDQSKKTEEVVNYEISHTTKTQVIEAGRLNRMSVAVLVDGNYVKDAKGQTTYQARPKEEIDRIAALVRSAIGFDQKRGDQLEVVNLRFAETPQNVIPEPQGWLSNFAFTKDDLMRGIELIVMALLGLIVLLLVVRPLVRRIITPEQGSGPATLPGPEETVALAPATSPPTPALADNRKGPASQMIDITQVQGQVHAQSVQKVGELADQNPQEAVAVIRQWLHASPA
jgi:flagellar M-ring protein FliF